MAIKQLLPKLNPLASATHAALVGLTFAAGAGVLAQSVHAQDEPGAESINRDYRIPAGPPVQLAQAEQVYELDIPPQPLSTALEVFSEQTDIRLNYTPTIVEGTRSNGVG